MSTIQQDTTKQKMFKGTAVFLTALCALGGFGLVKQMQIIKRISTENKGLRAYARTAQNLASNIQPQTLDNFNFCQDTNCMTCRAVKNGNERALKNYNTSLNTLNIDSKALATLRQGPQYQ